MATNAPECSLRSASKTSEKAPLQTTNKSYALCSIT